MVDYGAPPFKLPAYYGGTPAYYIEISYVKN